MSLPYFTDAQLEAIEAAGFEASHQGGNVFALQRNLENGRFILISLDDETDDFVVGIHNAEECIAYAMEPNIAAALEKAVVMAHPDYLSV